MTAHFDEGLLAVLNYFEPEAIIVRRNLPSRASDPVHSLVLVHKGGNAGLFRVCRLKQTGEFIEHCHRPFRTLDAALRSASAASRALPQIQQAWGAEDEG